MKTNQKRLTAVIAVAVLAASAVYAGSWINPGSGNWMDESNWEGGLPWQWQPAVIENGGTAVIDSPGTTVEAREVAVNTGSLIVNSGTLAPMWYVTVGGRSGDVGHLEINGGRVIGGWDNNFTIGSAGKGTAVLNNDGVIESDWFFVGGEVHRGVTIDGGTGEVTLNDNSQIIDTNGIVVAAGPNTTGTITLNDNSLMQTGGNLYVGYSGKGGVTVNNGRISAAGTTWVGGNSSSNGELRLNGGVLETSRVAKGSGQGSFIFDGGTLRARSNHNNFVSGFSSVQLASGGGTIDSGAYAVTVNSALSGEGSLIKQGVGSLTLAADNTIGGLNIKQGSLLLNAGRSISISGGEELITVHSGTTLSLLGNATAQSSLTALGTNGKLLLQSDATLILDPRYSHIEVSILELALSNGKVNVELLDFSGLAQGESLKILEFWDFAGDYGSDYDAGRYFSLVNPLAEDEAYYFKWEEGPGGKNGLYLTSIGSSVPETAEIALLLGGMAGCAAVLRNRRRRTAAQQ